MFVEQPPWRLVGRASIYRAITAFVAVAYFAVWSALILLVQDPWQAGWMLLGIFGPLGLVVVAVPLWLLLDGLTPER